MCKYCGTDKHRKIYENHIGSIPKDENNRTYDIHHIDGNHSNNDINNLIAVTIQEHFDIHKTQGNYGACLALAKRMKLTPEERSEMARKQQLERSKNGTHHFTSEHAKNLADKRKASGEFQLVSTQTQLRKVKNGTHPFLAKNRNFNNWAPTMHLKGVTGLNHPKSDRKIYSLENILTGEIETGTRKELMLKTQLNDDAISKLLREKQKRRGNWKLV
jgi:hypothetical protein